ncbi:protein TOXD [Apiospora arundinis]
MAPAADVDLYAPFEKDVILEVRSSKMKTMPGLSVQSGIDKLVREGRVPVSKIGIDDDEHDLVFHGGPDKAILGYCSSHYPDWQAEYPEAASRFQPGGFGENFVTKHMNERNGFVSETSTKLGSQGVGPLLQGAAAGATGPRRLVERRWPKWTIERVQEYLHRKLDDHAMNEELAAVEDMGKESRGNFQKRVAKQKAREKKAAAGEEDQSKSEKWKNYRIAEKKRQTGRIASFILEAVEKDPDAGDAELGGTCASKAVQWLDTDLFHRLRERKSL